MTITTSAQLNIGDRITIAGVHRPRTRWRRFVDWILRREPPPEPQVFRVSQVITSARPNAKTGTPGEFRIDTMFGDEECPGS